VRVTGPAVFPVGTVSRLVDSAGERNTCSLATRPGCTTRRTTGKIDGLVVLRTVAVPGVARSHLNRGGLSTRVDKTGGLVLTKSVYGAPRISAAGTLSARKGGLRVGSPAPRLTNLQTVPTNGGYRNV
jgi:hypothetical protein